MRFFVLNKRWVILTMVLLTSLFSNIWLKPTAFSADLEPKKLDKEDFDVIYIKIPACSRYQIIPVVSQKLEELPNLVDKVKDVAVAAINAGFFDPSNKETTSYVVAQGRLIANPVDNRRFVENPELYPYIADMLNRSEFRIMQCNGKLKYAIAKHRDALKFRCKLIHSIQAGPNLFDPDSAEKEAFIAYKDGQRLRDPIGIDNKNARSAIGLDENGNVIMAMIRMKPLENQSSGATLEQVADVMRELGAQQALSLDGGSSSSMWVGGETFYGKLDQAFNPVKRPIKSAFIVIREE